MATKKFADMIMDFSEFAPELLDEDGEPLNGEVNVKVKAITSQHAMRRIASELALEKELSWHWKQGVSYHCISAGDVDSLTYFRAAVKQQKIKYALLATWSCAMEDIRELRHWVKHGYIGRLDVYVGEMFLSAGRRQEHNELVKLCRESGGRLVIFRTHAKIMAIFGERFDCVIAGSANLNTNPRRENMIITVDSDLAWFYKECFDEIVSFERTFDDVKPWQPEN